MLNSERSYRITALARYIFAITLKISVVFCQKDFAESYLFPSKGIINLFWHWQRFCLAFKCILVLKSLLYWELFSIPSYLQVCLQAAARDVIRVRDRNAHIRAFSVSFVLLGSPPSVRFQQAPEGHR